MLTDPTTPYAAQSIAQEKDREELIRQGLPLVRRMAFRMARRLPPNVDVNDLIGAGTEGLLKAVQYYDAERYPQFEPYAKTRIRGAILDELRANDSLTRYGLSRMAEITNTIKLVSSQRNQITVLIAHRLSTVVNSDQIVVLDHGRVVGIGTHSELVATTPLYKQLAKHQLLV